MRLIFFAMLAGSLCYAHEPVSTKLTWTQEISRIVHNRCAGCHTTGGSAPMPLLTYADARPWAKAIKEEVLERRMPPWGAVKGFGEFREDPSLTQDEIMRIAEWVEGGSPEGDPAYLPPAPRPTAGATPAAGRRVRVLPPGATLIGLRPLASVESAQVVAKLPDGSAIPLLWLRNYQQTWGRTFVYREPICLPKGAQVTATPAIPIEYVIQRR